MSSSVRRLLLSLSALVGALSPASVIVSAPFLVRSRVVVRVGSCWSSIVGCRQSDFAGDVVRWLSGRVSLSVWIQDCLSVFPPLRLLVLAAASISSSLHRWDRLCFPPLGRPAQGSHSSQLSGSPLLSCSLAAPLAVPSSWLRLELAATRLPTGTSTPLNPICVNSAELRQRD